MLDMMFGYFVFGRSMFGYFEFGKFVFGDVVFDMLTLDVMCLDMLFGYGVWICRVLVMLCLDIVRVGYVVFG